MVTIVNYRERYQSDVEKLNAEMARQLASHADVVKESACVALCDGAFAGVGFLADTTPYRAQTGERAVRYMRAEFAAIPGSETEAEASVGAGRHVESEVSLHASSVTVGARSTS